MTSGERLQSAWSKAAAEHGPWELTKVGWSIEQVRRDRDLRLRSLVAHAMEWSPWHRDRLAGIDPSTLSADDLSALPPMTKADVMGNWDDIVCDPLLSLERAQSHLDLVSKHGATLLDSRYIVFVTGGSTGTRGVFVWDLWDWELACRSWTRKRGAPPNPSPVTALIYGRGPIHVGGMISFLQAPVAESRPADTPIGELRVWLTGRPPDVLAGYSSVVGHLASETVAGRLSIRPSVVMVTAEPATPEIVALVQDAWGVGLTNVYSTTECPALAQSEPGSDVLHLHEDIAIVEVVDASGEPVPLGTVGDRLLLTSLCNRTMPLIRYEITDQLAIVETPPGARWPGIYLSAPQGRSDDWFVYEDGTTLHPHAVRSVLAKRSSVVEYQVRQTPGGLEVDVCGVADTDLAAIRSDLMTALREAGLSGASVTVERTEAIERNLDTGKVRRFVPYR